MSYKVLIHDLMAQGHGVKNWNALLGSQAWKQWVAEGNQAECLVPPSLREQLAGGLSDRKLGQGTHFLQTTGSWKSDNWHSRFNIFRELQRAVKQKKYDMLLIQYSDYLVPFLPLLHGSSCALPTIALYFRPFLHYSDTGCKIGKKAGLEKGVLAATLKEKILQICLRRNWLRQVGFQDQAAVRWYQSKGYRAFYFPAPLSDNVISPLEKLPQSRSTFLLFGALSLRKGLGEVLQAGEKMDSTDSRKIRFLIRGAVYPPDYQLLIKKIKLLEEKGIEVDFCDGFVPQAAIRGLYAAADAVFVFYQGLIAGGSGVLAQAAAYGRPVLATEVGWIGKAVRENGLGITIPAGDTQGLIEAMKKVLKREVKFDLKLAMKFAEQSSPENYGRQIVKALRETAESK